MSVKIANVLKMIVKSLSDFFGRQIRLPAFFASELVQLTLIDREDGIFELHFRDDGEEFDPFQLAKEALAHQPKEMAEAARNTRGIGLHMVKSHAVNFFYRSYQGFNTLTLSI